MVSVIGNAFKDDLTYEVTRANYISMMADSTTDAGGLENETVYAHLICDGRPVNRLVRHRAVEHATAGPTANTWDQNNIKKNCT